MTTARASHRMCVKKHKHVYVFHLPRVACNYSKACKFIIFRILHMLNNSLLQHFTYNVITCKILLCALLFFYTLPVLYFSMLCIFICFYFISLEFITTSIASALTGDGAETTQTLSMHHFLVLFVSIIFYRR